MIVTKLLAIGLFMQGQHENHCSQIVQRYMYELKASWDVVLRTRESVPEKSIVLFVSAGMRW
jgi:hypothetical protein